MEIQTALLCAVDMRRSPLFVGLSLSSQSECLRLSLSENAGRTQAPYWSSYCSRHRASNSLQVSDIFSIVILIWYELSKCSWQYLIHYKCCQLNFPYFWWFCVKLVFHKMSVPSNSSFISATRGLALHPSVTHWINGLKC